MGKLAGRGFLLALAVVIGLAIGMALVWYPFGSVDPVEVVGHVVIVLLLGMAFLSISVAISLATRSKHLATVLAFGIFFLFVVGWDLAWGGLEFALDQTGLFDATVPETATVLYAIEPTVLYETVVVEGLVGDSIVLLGHTSPWYAHPVIALVVLLAWATLPIALANRRFREVDL